MNLKSAWEAFTERAAIMEYDAGLDRKAATLAAFALYFPKDFKAMKDVAAGKPDGETTLYEFLEGLIVSPGIALESPTTNAKTKNVESHGKTSKNLSITQEIPTIAIRKGLTALEYMVNRGIPLIGAYSSGAMIAKQEPGNFTSDPKEITALMAGKGDKKGQAKGTRIERFYFIPADAGLLCLDIDRKNGKDGINELFKIFDRDTLPAALADIEVAFPCYVKTPNNGYHFYFKYKGAPIKNAPLFPGIETKHGAPGLTAPGSYKNGNPYTLYGAIENAPPLYGIIVDKIQKRDWKPETRMPERMVSDRRSTFKKPFEGETPWGKIVNWTEQEGRGSEGRDAYAFHLAFKAATHNWTKANIEATMETMTWNFDSSFTRAQLRKCIKSAYDKAGGKI